MNERYVSGELEVAVDRWTYLFLHQGLPGNPQRLSPFLDPFEAAYHRLHRLLRLLKVLPDHTTSFPIRLDLLEMGSIGRVLRMQQRRGQV